MPVLLGVDQPNHIIVLQDLGVSNDFTFLYQKGKFLTDTELIDLLNFLTRLHHIPMEQLRNYPTNFSLRQLNHKHLFHYMFATDNGFDLNSIQPGLQEIALPYKNSPVLIKQVEELGKSYLAQGDTLIHGDYYPGSWLKAKEKVMIIDPEFSFIGKREFELGVLIAHLKMVEAPTAQFKLIEREYEADRNFSWPCCYQYAGVEMIRRIIGLAQLPLDLSLREKEELLKESCRLIIA